MKFKLILGIPVILLFYSYGFAKNNPANKLPCGDTTKLPPVETNGGNTNYQPAFKGQTRVAGV
ncbi:MAG: hypothetical protein ACXWC7_19860, partial [Chitinophagaceae bacterium]